MTSNWNTDVATRDLEVRGESAPACAIAYGRTHHGAKRTGASRGACAGRKGSSWPHLRT